MDIQPHPVAPPSQAQQIVTPASLQTRLQQHQQPQQTATNLTGFQHHHQHQPHHPRPNLSDYETPPRHRRGLIPPHSGSLPHHNVGLINSPLNHRSNNQRHISQRHNLNGRGIMGQGPKPMRIDHIRPSNNF